MAARGVLLFGSELTMLRRAHICGGTIIAPDTGTGWNAASELCRLGMLSREGEVLRITSSGRKAIALTSAVAPGGVGFISPQLWTTP